MKSKRESNYDLLRILSALAVIVIHVSLIYVSAASDASVFGTVYSENVGITCFYNMMPRFAVPCFVMLSGAFVLADERNKDYRFFYRKSFKNIVIPTILFSFLYCIYSYITGFADAAKSGQGFDVSEPLKAWLKGAPYYHMWYMYMLIGLYLLVPIVIKFKNDIGNKNFEKVAGVFLVFSSVSQWTSTHTVYWDIGYVFGYLGYFMIGYVLRRNTMEKKSNLKGIILVLIGVFVQGFSVLYLLERQEFKGYLDISLLEKIVDPHCPSVVIASVLIFAGFSCMRIKKDFSKMASCTYLIYLFHAGVWGIMFRAIKKILDLPGDNSMIIPVASITVFFISFILANMYQKIWSFIEEKL